MSDLNDFKGRRDLALASIDCLALLSYVVDACSHRTGVSDAELCAVAKDLGLMVERPMTEDDAIEGVLPGEPINAFSERLRIDLATGRTRIAERYRSDKH